MGFGSRRLLFALWAQQLLGSVCFLRLLCLFFLIYGERIWGSTSGELTRHHGNMYLPRVKAKEGGG